MSRLKDKVAIITAAGSGMGRASALLFAQEGAKVVVSDIDRSRGQETVKHIKEAGGEATFVQADVSKVLDMERMVKASVDTYGKLNILYNHAGMPGAFKLEGVSEEEWQTSIEVNAKGSFFATKYAVPEMRKIGVGSVIFTASTAGLVGSSYSPVYSFAKGGIVNMTKSLALLLAPDNIRVNCICPGMTDTPMTLGFMGPGTDEEKEERRSLFLKTVPLGRMARPEEMAYATLFLASDESSFVTGIALPVDGGWTAR
jgi:NAD(P)-dependent dehydrogenase (short-subunit alcohol dehydrogenase family)